MSSTLNFDEFDFSGAMRDLRQGLLVKPILHNYLYDARFPAFDLHFAKQAMERAPDGFFHPSTHPEMHPRLLYHYLAHPETFPVEKKKYMGTLAVTLGKVAHEFVEVCLTDAGIRPARLNTCQMCPPEAHCTEAGVLDTELGERGHMDGVLSFDGYPNVPDEKMEPVFEFKCLAPEVPISLVDGSLKPAGEIVEGDWILGWDEITERCAPRQVQRVWNNGIVPVWTVTTRSGRSLGVTDEHPFLTNRGWVFARDLGVGYKVRTAWGSEWFDGHEEPYSAYEGEEGPEAAAEDAYFFGVMIGDGCLTGTGVMLSCADNDMLEGIRAYVSDRGADLRYVAQYDYSITVGRKGRYQNPIRELLRREGMLNCNSRTKRIPSSVWTGGPRVWAEFLSGYFDADGTVVTTGSYPHLAWSSVNRPLLVECQMLLSYLGVRSSVMQVKSGDHTSWRLLVRDRRAVQRATEVIVPRHHQKMERMMDMQVEDRPDGRWVREHQQGWDEVSSVQVGLARPTVAIEVDGGTHVTAGVITHNTSHDEFGRLTKVPDLDVEAYRAKWPDYYGQNQRYMKMSGRPFTVVLMMEMVYPFTMREFHVPYDIGYNAQIDAKYRVVRQAVADQRPPMCCGSKACPLAVSCGVIR